MIYLYIRLILQWVFDIISRIKNQNTRPIKLNPSNIQQLNLWPQKSTENAIRTCMLTISSSWLIRALNAAGLQTHAAKEQTALGTAHFNMQLYCTILLVKCIIASLFIHCEKCIVDHNGDLKMLIVLLEELLAIVVWCV